MHGAVLNYLRLDPLHYRTCGQTSVLTKHLVTERRVFRNAKPYVPLRLGSSIHAPGQRSAQNLCAQVEPHGRAPCAIK